MKEGQGQTRQMKDRRYVIFTAPQTDVFMLFLYIQTKPSLGSDGGFDVRRDKNDIENEIAKTSMIMKYASLKEDKKECELGGCI
jgi:hypothetical protein